jgi:hypothetical protein
VPSVRAPEASVQLVCTVVTDGPGNDPDRAAAPRSRYGPTHRVAEGRLRRRARGGASSAVARPSRDRSEAGPLGRADMGLPGVHVCSGPDARSTVCEGPGAGRTNPGDRRALRITDAQPRSQRAMVPTPERAVLRKSRTVMAVSNSHLHAHRSAGNPSERLHGRAGLTLLPELGRSVQRLL